MSFKLTLGKIGQPRQARHNGHNGHNAMMPMPATEGGCRHGMGTQTHNGYHNQSCIQAG